MLNHAALFLGLLVSFAVAQLTSADVQAFLDAHNTVRSQHNAKALVWSSTVAASAQKWADGCNKVHSHSQQYGENLFWGTAWAYGIPAAVKFWADEGLSYATNPVYSHFTQVVWKSTTQLGCGVQICGEVRFIVCQYYPPGNVVGQLSQNVE